MLLQGGVRRLGGAGGCGGCWGRWSVPFQGKGPEMSPNRPRRPPAPQEAHGSAEPFPQIFQNWLQAKFRLSFGFLFRRACSLFGENEGFGPFCALPARLGWHGSFGVVSVHSCRDLRPATGPRRAHPPTHRRAPPAPDPVVEILRMSGHVVHFHHYQSPSPSPSASLKSSPKPCCLIYIVSWN